MSRIKKENTMRTPVTATYHYLPVRREDGTLAVQITDPDGVFCGWVDGTEKYGYSGSWEICEAWSRAQTAQVEQRKRAVSNYALVSTKTEGLLRIITAVF